MKTLFRRKNITDSSNCCITVSEYIVNTSHFIDSLTNSFSTYVPRELEQFLLGSACKSTLNCSSVIFACDVGTLINTYLFRSLQNASMAKTFSIKNRFEGSSKTLSHQNLRYSTLKSSNSCLIRCSKPL